MTVKSQITKFQAIKGVRDILPPDSTLWNRVEATAREVFETYGYGESRVPVIESTELFARSIGVETDVVSKEMYTFEDRDNGVGNAATGGHRIRRARLHIEHGMYNRPGNTKLYYMGPMFRRERPQKGRYRQFYQIGAELLGSSDHAALDAEVLEMLLAFFERVGLKGAVLSINSIGDKNCRPAYVERLRGELEKFRDRLGPDSQRRIETNPLRVLDSKIPEEQAVIALLPRIADHLCADCKAHYAKLRQELELRNITYQENWRLVRGLDYYMRTTFEITAPGLGSQDAVCGGGRYDGLVELLGGPATTKCIGFAIGTDRLVLSLQAQAAEAAKAARAAASGAQCWRRVAAISALLSRRCHRPLAWKYFSPGLATRLIMPLWCWRGNCAGRASRWSCLPWP